MHNGLYNYIFIFIAVNIILLLTLSANPYFRGLMDEFDSSNELPAFVEII